MQYQEDVIPFIQDMVHVRLDFQKGFKGKGKRLDINKNGILEPLERELALKELARKIAPKMNLTVSPIDATEIVPKLRS